ncbi:MAG: hypothetical protein C4320_02285, partial [Armatimonadota bacterium]
MSSTSLTPSQLTDRTAVAALDPNGMWGLVEAFPAQCRRALAIAQQAEFPAPKAPLTAAILTGMGGSASGGDFTRALFEHAGSIPFSVNRDYR